MNQSESRPAPIGIGVISILTVLLVLALSLFAALTLASARADLALSQRNADTVQAYYTADAEAARLYDRFAAGDKAELETTLPVTDQQYLALHFVRQADGSVRILQWQTVSVEPEIDEHLPVWDGSIPQS